MLGIKKVLVSCVVMTSILPVGAGEVLWIDSFGKSQIGSPPFGWQGRSEAAARFYIVAEEKKNKFLRAHTKRSHEFVGKQIAVDIVKYPYLNWRWRAQIFPPNGNEGKKETGDTAASVSVVLEDDRILGVPKPKTLKYTWSTTLPAGFITESPWAVWPSRCDIIVLRSGTAQKGHWLHEKRNILADYLKFYKLKKDEISSKVIKGLVLMSDSDNTISESAADYDDFYFSAD